MKRKLMKRFAGFLVVVMFVVGVTSKGIAGFSASEPTGLLQIDRTSDLGKIQKSLELKIVRERLHQLGFTADEIQGKLGRLGDEQIHQLALRMDTAKVGGDAVLGVGILILLALVLVVSAIAYFSGME
jgi:hypothetical protein